MALKGNLQSFFLTSILQLLHNERKTGALYLTQGEENAHIIILEGSIVYAMSSRREARLGTLLMEKGKITLEQLQECLDQGKQKKMALGKVLVENGFISIETLEEFIRQQVEEIIYALFLWEAGDFEYRDARLDLSGLVATRLDITRVMLEASRRIDEMSILKKQIPGDHLVFSTTSLSRGTEIDNLDFKEKEILRLIDGKHTVQHLLEQSGYDRYTVYKAIYSLISYNMIEKRDDTKKDGPKENKPNKQDDEYLTAIITGYSNIMQIISKNLEPELGKESLVLLEECKPEALPGQKDLFKDFFPDHPAPHNIVVIRENLKHFKNLKNERVFLIESFNRFILNILNRVPDILGIGPTQKMMLEVEKNLPFISEYMKGLNMESTIAEDVKKITTRVEQLIKEREKDKQKSGRILSMFKKQQQ